MCKFKSLAFHANMISAFVFVSSRKEGDDVVVESFVMIQDGDELKGKSAHSICYTPSALDCINDENEVKYCLKREIERSQIEVERLVYEKCGDENRPWGVASRFRPFIERLRLEKIDAGQLARNVFDVNQLSFVCQSKCSALVEYVAAARTIKMGLRISDIGRGPHH